MSRLSPSSLSNLHTEVSQVQVVKTGALFVMKTVARKSKHFDSPIPTISFRIQLQAKKFFLCLLRQDNNPLRSDSQIDCGIHTSLLEAIHTSFKTNFAYVSETNKNKQTKQKQKNTRKSLWIGGTWKQMYRQQKRRKLPAKTNRRVAEGRGS